MASAFDHIPSRADQGCVHVVIDTPRGSRNKYKVNEAFGCFQLSRILPLGASFPWNFGFIPNTRAADGDALDVLVVADEPMAIGLLLRVRLLGVIAALQTERGRTIHNDRLIGIPVTKVNRPRARDLRDLDPVLLSEVEHFFVSYNAAQGRTFRVIRRLGASGAERLLNAAIRE